MILFAVIPMAVAGFFWSPTWYAFVLWEMPAAVTLLALFGPPLIDWISYWSGMRAFRQDAPELVFLPGKPSVVHLDWYRSQRDPQIQVTSKKPVEEAS